MTQHKKDGPVEGKLYRVVNDLHNALAINTGSNKIGLSAMRHHIIPEGTIVIALDTQLIFEAPFVGGHQTTRYVYNVEYLAKTSVFRTRIEGHVEDCWTAFFEPLVEEE